jgi:acetyl esterase/lipase
VAQIAGILSKPQQIAQVENSSVSSRRMSWQNRLLTWALRRWVKPNSRHPQDVPASRKLTERMPFGARLAPGWRIRAGTGAASNGEWIEPIVPDDPARTRCILYFHGGAYISMSARTHRAITSRLAAWSGAALFALDYRLAPEHPFPAALQDAIAAYRAIIETGISPSQIVVAGDSAGGGLALSLLLALRDAGMKLPAAAVLFSPSTDLAATGESIVGNSDADAMFFGPWIAAVAQHYLAGTPATNPLASPVYGDLTGLPALLIQVGDSEVLLDDSRRVHDKARRSGVECRLQLWRGVPHGWQIFASFLPEASAALRDAGAFIRAQLAK